MKSNKNDFADAEAIGEAVARPHLRSVPVKSVEQQSVLSPLEEARVTIMFAYTAVV